MMIQEDDPDEYEVKAITDFEAKKKANPNTKKLK